MEKSTHRINYYHATDPYGELSNFYYSPFTLKGKVWDTAEHYFQAQKHVGTPLEEEIRNTKDPGDAKKLARSFPYSRKDWQGIKQEIMYEGCLEKFKQNPRLLKYLLDTGDAYLAEHTENDTYWGDGGDDSGQNWAGKTLMKIRKNLKLEDAEKLGVNKL